ncbi:MAG: SpoIIE family protein phosphatase [Eubacterium sp.]|nr:SpoIIE family protein phosphatase [Eubacterium sp.]
MRFKKKIRTSIILEVAVLFAAGVLTTGIFSWFTQYEVSDVAVQNQTITQANQIANEVRRAVREYPAHNWLLKYWYQHADELEIEYDVSFTGGTQTEKKCRQFSERHPDLQLRYLQTPEIEKLPAEDQKLYAEITYSWLTTRINQIKRTYGVDFLFAVVTQTPYTEQFFLFSASDVGAVRGTEYLQVYPLGHSITVDASLQNAMKNALQYSENLADAGEYLDYYAYLERIDRHAVLIGLTFSKKDLDSSIAEQVESGIKYSLLNQISLSVLVLLLLILFLLRPLKKVQQNIRLYQKTKDSEQVIKNLREIRSSNEIGQLTDDVSDMVKEIDDHVAYIETITAEKERIEAELSLANRIQANMLPNVFPPFPDRKEFDIYASMDPAREVGGDFFDYFLIDRDHLCMVMADVSGKGVPAALFMMASKIVLANNAMMKKSPAQILADANNAICANNREEMFVTVWLGILEISTGKVIAANAGHEYPVLMHPGKKFELIKDTHGFVLGGMEDLVFKDYVFRMRPGAKLFLYTDGVPEATDAEKEMFGIGRMLEALNEQRTGTPEEVLASVRQAVDAFVRDEEQFDDLTMMCVSYQGPEK